MAIHTTTAAGTDAVITKAATTGTGWRINWIAYGYSANAGAETLIVTVGGTTVFTLDIPASAHPLFLPVNITGGAGLAVVITLSGGGGASNSVNADIDAIGTT